MNASTVGPRFYTWFWSVAPLIFVLTWAGGYSFAKLGLQYVQPMTLLALRYLIAFLLMLPFIFLLKVPLPRNYFHWYSLIVTGFLIQGVYFGLAYLAMKEGIDAGTVALILSLQPILVAVLAPLAVGEKVHKKHWLGLLMGLAGATIVIVAKGEIVSSSRIAIVLALGALIGITAATLFEKKFGVKTHPVMNGIVQYAVGCSLIAPIALILEPQEIIWHPDLFLSLGYLVVVNSIISISILIGLIQRDSVSKVSALFFLVPPLAFFIAWLMLGEVMPNLAWLGLLLSMVGIFVVNNSSRSVT